MTGIHHRDVGVAGWTLSNRGVTFDIIADGIHVDERMLDLACRAKGVSGVCLISDSVAPTGLGNGAYELWGEHLTVENGRTRNERGSIAGSVITMADAVRRMRSLGYSGEENEAMSSANPARLVGLAARGSLRAGQRADIVVVDESGAVADVWVGGERVFGDSHSDEGLRKEL
jgi:N-acetylglucosamine-6-phosphate deacetylase